MPAIAARKPISRKPMEIKNSILRQRELAKVSTKKRELKRENLSKEISEFDKKVNRLPENKRPIVQKQLLRKLEARHNYIQANIEKISQNLHRYKFNEKNITFLETLRKQEVKRTNNNQYQMWDYAEQKLKAGYKPIELLKAGYNVGEVTAGVFRLETKRKA
ncbi:MAG TPA: hypothetical protein PLK55_03420 [archaeon]|nr:hypothetical protein [archaeon]